MYAEPCQDPNSISWASRNNKKKIKINIHIFKCLIFKSISELLKPTNTDEKYRKFIFFSEGKFYTNHFIDLVDNLKKIYGKDYIHYVTLDKFEKSKLSNHANVYVVNNSFVVRLLFKIIKCETFIMTMSDLNI